MKKYIVIICCLVLLTGCGNKNKLSDEILESRENILNLIGATDDNRIVIKSENNDNELYYVYEISTSSFVEYLYTFYSSEEEYTAGVEKYGDNTYYSLQKYEDALVLKITMERGKQNGDDDLYTTIMNRYDDDNYEIIN